MLLLRGLSCGRGQIWLTGVDWLDIQDGAGCRGWGRFWQSAGAVAWGASMWPLCGAGFLAVWQSQESNTSSLAALGTRSECSEAPWEKLKGFG